MHDGSIGVRRQVGERGGMKNVKTTRALASLQRSPFSVDKSRVTLANLRRVYAVVDEDCGLLVFVISADQWN